MPAPQTTKLPKTSLASSKNLTLHLKKKTRTILAARGTYHYELAENFDTYGGLSFGFQINNTTNFGGYPGNEGSVFKFFGGIFIGGKYYLTDSFAVFSELGFNASWLTLGINLKF